MGETFFHQRTLDSRSSPFFSIVDVHINKGNSSPLPPTSSTAINPPTTISPTPSMFNPRATSYTLDSQLPPLSRGWESGRTTPEWQRRPSAAWLAFANDASRAGADAGVVEEKRRGSSSSDQSLGEPKGEKESGKLRGELYRTEMCRTMMEKGNCPYGNKCEYAHSQSELRPIYRPWNYKTKQCRTFHEKGHCPYGKRCHYLHTGGPEEIPPNVIIWPRLPNQPLDQQDEQPGRRFSMPTITRPSSSPSPSHSGVKNCPLSPISPQRNAPENDSGTMAKSLFNDAFGMRPREDPVEDEISPPTPTRILPRDLMEQLINSPPTSPLGRQFGRKSQLLPQLAVDERAADQNQLKTQQPQYRWIF
ncbi:uncharacterized protein VTP21DRAFT_2180 [Calcarisporiella thermophila]|uniref:uncharacterized protein n=1 Tax=Calcarisporiella thermophila TaxID=911321 RepID=UPI0037433594